MGWSTREFIACGAGHNALMVASNATVVHGAVHKETLVTSITELALI